MGVAEEKLGELDQYDQTIKSDIKQLQDLPLNEFQKTNIYGEILEYQSDINSINNLNNLIQRIGGEVKAKLVNDKSIMVSKDLTILTKGFECAKKNKKPDEEGNCDSSITDTATPTTGTGQGSPEKKEPPATIETDLPYNPLPGSTVGNRESFQTYSNYNIGRGFGVSTMPFIEGLKGLDENLDATKPGSNIMDKEKELIKDLLEFNEKYARYLHCNDKYAKAIDTTCLNYMTEKVNGYTNINYLNNLGEQINYKITDINAYLDSIKDGDRTGKDKYSKNHNNLISNHNSVLKLRNELDMKLTELYNPEKSVLADYKTNFDSTIYSGILISALATSMLFYVFTEI